MSKPTISHSHTVIIAFLKVSGKDNGGGSNVISIDRSNPFNPREFLGNEWSIGEQDNRSIALTTIDLAEVVLGKTLKRSEKSIQGEHNLKRLKEKNRICLDAGIFTTLWENKDLIPIKWKEKTDGNTTHILFNGTILCDAKGLRFVLSLYWNYHDDRWSFLTLWLDGSLYSNRLSAVLVNDLLVSSTN